MSELSFQFVLLPISHFNLVPPVAVGYQNKEYKTIYMYKISLFYLFYMKLLKCQIKSINYFMKQEKVKKDEQSNNCRLKTI